MLHGDLVAALLRAVANVLLVVVVGVAHHHKFRNVRLLTLATVVRL
jgi:hypothetical protein